MPRRKSLNLPVLWLLLAMSSAGCTLFHQSVPAGPPAALSWLTNWGNHPLESDAFDLELIKPAPKPAPIAAGNLLEITVWDLYEPGKPYTFPVRVTATETISVPLLNEVPIKQRSIPELETTLAEAYRTGEFLLQPRVLVRSLDMSLVKVHVTGAVQRTGFVELGRDETNVYAALVSAGGLKKNAGAQVAVTRQQSHTATSGDVAKKPVADDSTGSTTWYDITRTDERQSLKQLTLSAGDTILVKTATPPIRIGGVVARPGNYPLPPGRILNVWQALELAGGVQVVGVPLNVTLYRPATETRAPQRWFASVETIEERPTEAPTIEPGDILHVETTAGSKISRSVKSMTSLWSRDDATE